MTQASLKLTLGMHVASLDVTVIAEVPNFKRYEMHFDLVVGLVYFDPAVGLVRVSTYSLLVEASGG